MAKGSRTAPTLPEGSSLVLIRYPSTELCYEFALLRFRPHALPR